MSSWCLVVVPVLSLFIMVPWVGLQSVIVLSGFIQASMSKIQGLFKDF